MKEETKKKDYEIITNCPKCNEKLFPAGTEIGETVGVCLKGHGIFPLVVRKNNGDDK